MTTPYAYILDTNILSDLARNPTGKAASCIRKTGEHRIATSLVVAAEIRFGLRKLGSTRLKERIEQLIERIPILPFEEPADLHYGEIRHYLEKGGTPIGPNDLLIAAHVRSLGLILVTDNVKEFRRVPNLKVENWLT